MNLKKALQALNIFCSKSLFNFANGVDGEIISLNKIKLNYNFTTPKIYNIVDYLKIGVNDALTNNHDALEDCKVVLKKLNNVIGQTTNKNNKISINETTRSPLIHELVLKYDKNN